MKHYILIRPNTYPLTFRVFLGYKNKDKAEILRHIRSRSKETREAVCHTIKEMDIEAASGYYVTKNTLSVIIIPTFNLHNPEHYGYLAHELEHAIINSGKQLSFGLSHSSEEYYCYMMGFLTERIYRRLWG